MPDFTYLAKFNFPNFSAMSRFPVRTCLPFVLSSAARILVPIARSAERQLDAVLADVLLPGPLGIVVHRFSRYERAVASADLAKAEAAAASADARMTAERWPRHAR
ncbi:unnamed protein product [Closterium sp. NIES-65]|nr:unnamed protein product [Closterium sp. NIES-65]